MARPIKQGLEYCSLDTDILGERKIKRLLKTFGPKGFTIYIALLCEIYKDKGYYIQWDDELAFDVSDIIPGTTEQLVKDVVSFCVECGLFEKSVFSVRTILTSAGIQKRYKKAKEGRKQVIDPSIWVIGKETQVNEQETGVDWSESTQSKEKESKEEKRKEKAPPLHSGNLPPPVKTENSAPQAGGAEHDPPVKHLVPLMLANWLKKLPDYPQDSEKDSQALGGLSRFIAKVKKEAYEPDNGSCVDIILASWDKVAEFVSKDDFYKSFSLHQVERHIQNILQRMKNERSKTGTENQKPTGVAVPSGPRTYGRL